MFLKETARNSSAGENEMRSRRPPASFSKAMFSSLRLSRLSAVTGAGLGFLIGLVLTLLRLLGYQ